MRICGWLPAPTQTRHAPRYDGLILPPVRASFEASIIGALFGLVLLPQVTSTAGRWWC